MRNEEKLVILQRFVLNGFLFRLTFRSSGPASLSPRPPRCPRPSSGRRPSSSRPSPPSTRTSAECAPSSPPSRPSCPSPATATSSASASAVAAPASGTRIEISAAAVVARRRLPVLGAIDRGPSSAARKTSSSVVCRGTFCLGGCAGQGQGFVKQCECNLAQLCLTLRSLNFLFCIASPDSCMRDGLSANI